LLSFATKQYLYAMARKNAKNIKAYNDNFHKAQKKVKEEAAARKEKLSAIIKKYNDSKAE